MKNLLLNKTSYAKQYSISFVLIAVMSGLCYAFSGFIGYKVVAFILLVTVSFIAMFFDILPVLLAAVLSALVWNFFFIPPRFTFSINSTEDALMFSMYFVVAMVNGVFTYKIRQIEKEENLKEEREKTLKLYNTLLNSLSHELRTPISTIIGASDNLQSPNTNLSDQHKEELLFEISKASLRLNRQVENLLNMSRLESGFVHVKEDWCDVNELIYNTIGGLQEYLQGKTVSIHIKEDLPLFKLDEGLLDQVLQNLIYNASLYIPAQGRIQITADSKEDLLVLTVEDNGPGFPENAIPRVFDKFYRLEGAKTGGTGLGLSIVKGFVEAHNGTVRLENAPGGGARFTIEIPAEASYLNHLKHE